MRRMVPTSSVSVSPCCSCRPRSLATYAAKRASSIGVSSTSPSLSRSNRALTVTCPRVTPRRRASRTSPSSRASAPGSLMDGLKKRWFTERTSTLTRPPPTSPSAAPNPVMLRIISSSVSYGHTRRLSIPEVPPYTIELHLPRQEEAWHLGIVLLQQVAELIRHDGRLNPDLELERDGAVPKGGAYGVVRLPEVRVASVLVRQRGQQPEVSARKAVQQV